MVRKRKRAKPEPPQQDIPKHIVKGDPVLYMLQRVSYHHCILVDCVVSSNFKQWERYLLDLFKDKAFRMTKRYKRPGWFSPNQVKFGITRNLPQRLEDINEDIFESGVTEWRSLTNAEMIIAHNKFWWYRNRGKVYFFLFATIVGFLGWAYLITEMN